MNKPAPALLAALICVGVLVPVAVLCGSAQAASTQGFAPVDARIKAQNALFEDYYESDLKAHPERATAYGDYRYNDRLEEVSLEAIEQQRKSDEHYLGELRAISTQGFPEQDALSHELLRVTLEQQLQNHRFKEFEMPVNQMDGPHIRLADLPRAAPFDTVKQYEDYLARLHQIPRVFTQVEGVLRAGLRDHLMPVKFLLEKIPAQCQGVIDADPFLLPLQKFPASVPDADRSRLGKAITAAVNDEVFPAYRAFAQFIATEYAPHGRTVLSIESLEGGKERYLNDIRSRTTVGNLSPAQIHAIGLKEIGRIEGEMSTIAHKQGYADLPALRAAVAADPKYKPASADAIVEDFRRYVALMQPKLPELFTYLPGSPVTVEPMPAFQAASATHYQTGTPDGKRPGRIVVAVSNAAERSLVDDEATAYHEGIPGHHLQRSVAQQMTGLPRFRQHIGNSGYIEGWALYAEELGKEVGLYRDPISDYGRLSSELFRAVRLVVDTGLHSEGWSRDQVVAFFRKSGAVDEPTLQSETDRYISWPAQALSYKLGQLKFRELRERARQALGTKFDVRKFHDEMLNGGVLPLDLLDARTNAWIQAQKSG
jgi:uncharacterized protein (DUF885 family)